MKKFTVALKFVAFIWLCGSLVSLRSANGPDEMASSLQEILQRFCAKSEPSAQIKRVDLQVTNTGFCRYKKYFTNGKTEFYAFNVNRFKEMDYIGTETRGNLLLHTLHDDVIVQTYNDKRGDVDSMGTCLTIPLKNVNAEDLNLVYTKFKALKKALN